MNGVAKATVQSSSNTETNGVLNKDTGFPEPLSPHRNTTLRHPSADTSPNACIESSDPPSYTRPHARNPSFQLRNKRPTAKGTISGILTPDNALSDASPWTDGSVDPSSEEQLTRQQQQQQSSTAAATTTTAAAVPDEAQRLEQRADVGIDEQGHREGERKKGLLRKMQLHKA